MINIALGNYLFFAPQTETPIPKSKIDLTLYAKPEAVQENSSITSKVMNKVMLINPHYLS
jgi:hypothetical protein